MKAKALLLVTTALLGSTCAWANTMVCPMLSVPNTTFAGLGDTAELCGPVSLAPELTLQASGSSMVTATTLMQWLGTDAWALSPNVALFGQGVMFRDFQAAAGAELALNWALSFPVDMAGTLFYVFNGQVGILGTDTTGAGVSSAGVLRLITAGGSNTLALGIINTVTNSGAGSLVPGFRERALETSSGPTATFGPGAAPPVTLVPFEETPEPSTMALTAGLLLAILRYHRKA
ncbi:MAG: hypothetical protein SFV51_12490 [Bryobacteraceae bacterium]|nr:hypothetical protein [Bryobacteraceae bacterium]